VAYLLGHPIYLRDVTVMNSAVPVLYNLTVDWWSLI